MIKEKRVSSKNTYNQQNSPQPSAGKNKLSDRAKIALQYAMPKHAISRLTGRLASAQMGWLTTKLISLFIKAYGINMNEAKLKNANDFATFNDFFYPRTCRRCA